MRSRIIRAISFCMVAFAGVGDAMQPAEFDDLPIQIIRLDIGFTVCDGLEG